MQHRSRSRVAGVVSACLAAAPVAARVEILPTLFNVAGVAASDALNIRAAPSAEAEILGTLPPDATGIEVISLDASGRWAQVNTTGRSGWVSMHYLEPRANVWQDGEAPDGLRCLGTEPFWSLAPVEGRLAYRTPEAEREYRLDAVLSPGFPSPRRALTGSDAGGRIVATIVPARCTDGMSDRAYGLEATVILDDGAPRMLTGCCTLSD